MQQLGQILNQSHISPKNVKYLTRLRGSQDPEAVRRAEALLALAAIYPYRRYRRKLVLQNRKLRENLRALWTGIGEDFPLPYAGRWELEGYEAFDPDEESDPLA